jgi:hypothetical protein
VLINQLIDLCHLFFYEKYKKLLKLYIRKEYKTPYEVVVSTLRQEMRPLYIDGCDKLHITLAAVLESLARYLDRR